MIKINLLLVSIPAWYNLILVYPAVYEDISQKALLKEKNISSQGMVEDF